MAPGSLPAVEQAKEGFHRAAKRASQEYSPGAPTRSRWLAFPTPLNLDLRLRLYWPGVTDGGSSILFFWLRHSAHRSSQGREKSSGQRLTALGCRHDVGRREFEPQHAYRDERAQVRRLSKAWPRNHSGHRLHRCLLLRKSFADLAGRLMAGQAKKVEQHMDIPLAEIGEDQHLLIGQRTQAVVPFAQFDL